MERDEMFLEDIGERIKPMPKWMHGLYYLMFVVQGLILIHLIIG